MQKDFKGMRYSLKKKILRISIIFISLNLFAGNYQFEGVFRQPDGDERFFLVGQFIPFNPNILALNSKEDASQTCAYWWPNGTFCTEALRDQKYDFVWIESEGRELEILQNLSDILPKTSAIYTPTHFVDQGAYYQSLKFFLELSGFTLLSHWYWEGEQGNAIFLKKELFDAAMRTLNCWPQPSNFVNYPSFYNLEHFFRSLPPKSKDHSFGEIDFIYMINLDERPEKFSKAAGGLELYGIHPYRFSAVNGWKLPLESIEQLGVKFPQGTLREQFMGSTYHEIDGALYRSNQIIQEDGGTYFSIGLSQGAIGIVLSHLSILQDAYDTGYRTIWVMEDDVEAVDDPGQIPDLIRSLEGLAPDWDILFTDTDTKDIHGNHVPCRALAARPNFCTQTLESFWPRFYPMNNDLSRIGMRYGAYSMIIRRSGIEKILNYFKTYGVFLPYDMDFWLIPDLKMYSVNKDIISHAAGAPTDNNLPHYLKKK